ncbi:MAG TPA: hypothetical protein PLV68_17450 [Ilumatobacteraceae bacterium]|nr:hypothetical protein [Ilumatobacteraceae bacterium]
MPPTSTRREAAQFVGAGATLLAERADQAVFGPGEPTDAEVEQYWTDLHAQLVSMRSQLGVVARAKAAVNITSLRQARATRRAVRMASTLPRAPRPPGALQPVSSNLPRPSAPMSGAPSHLPPPSLPNAPHERPLR